MDYHQAAMLAVRLRVFADHRFEIDAVVGDQGPALLLGHIEEVWVTHPSKAWIVRGSYDVMTTVSESFGNLAADLLVEEELHAKAACSRCQAASASSASSELRAIRRSISAVKAP